MRNLSQGEANELRRMTPESAKFELCRPVCSVSGCLFSPKCRYHGVTLCHKHFSVQYMRDRRPAPTDPRYFLGAFGEAAIRNIFVAHGRKLEDQASKCKFDFLVDGWRVEVKTTMPRRKGGWIVNFQRNGILDEQTDFYVIRLESQYDPINILLPAPAGQTGMLFQRGPMIWQRRDDFNAFARGELVAPRVTENHLRRVERCD